MVMEIIYDPKTYHITVITLCERNDIVKVRYGKTLTATKK
jgi:hypothetical protein